MTDEALREIQVKQVLGLLGSEEAKTHICTACDRCRKCEGTGTKSSSSLCLKCYGLGHKTEPCESCAGIRHTQGNPDKGCRECSCDWCRCSMCLGTGKAQLGVTWEVEFVSGAIGYLCSRHFHRMDWTCEVCGRTNPVQVSRCFCKNVRADECRKCRRYLMDGGLYKLVDGTCPRCEGLGIHMERARKHIGDCEECALAEEEDTDAFRAKALDILKPDPEIEFPCGAPKYFCPGCYDHRTGESRGAAVRSKSAQWLIQSVDLTDVDRVYHAELKPYVGQYLCLRCLCPDVQTVSGFSRVDPKTGTDARRMCLICQKDGKKTQLSRFNPSDTLCFQHRDFCGCGHPKDKHVLTYEVETRGRTFEKNDGCGETGCKCRRFMADSRTCVKCGKELDLSEGPFCAKHTTCPMCDDAPEKGEVTCKKHRHIKGYGAFLDRGGSKFSTEKPMNPAGAMEKWERLERVMSLVSRKLDKASDRGARLERKLRELEMEEARLNGNDPETQLHLTVIAKEKEALEDQIDKAMLIIEKYRPLNDLLQLAVDRFNETKFGNQPDLPVEMISMEEAMEIAARKEPHSLAGPHRIKCMVCDRVHEDPEMFEWTVGVFPGNTIEKLPRGKHPSRYLACLSCLGKKPPEKKSELSTEEARQIQRDHWIDSILS